MDISKLKPGDWLIGGGTLVFFISMFLTWYKAEATGDVLGVAETVTAKGWDYEVQGWLPLLLLLVATVLVVLPKLRPSITMPDTIGPATRLQAALIATGSAAGFVFLRLAVKDGDDTAAYDISRGIGLFLAFLAAAAATAGAYIKYAGKEAEVTGAGSAPATPT